MKILPLFKKVKKGFIYPFKYIHELLSKIRIGNLLKNTISLYKKIRDGFFNYSKYANNYLGKANKYPIPYAILIFVFIMIIPFVVIYFFSTTDSGVIGDTFGGITAPFLSFISAVLVYISFREQRKANEIQIEALDKQKKIYEKEKEQRDKKENFNLALTIFNELKYKDSDSFIPYSFDNKSTNIRNIIFLLKEKIFGVILVNSKESLSNLRYEVAIFQLVNFLKKLDYFIDMLSDRNFEEKDKKMLKNDLSNYVDYIFPENTIEFILTNSQHFKPKMAEFNNDLFPLFESIYKKVMRSDVNGRFEPDFVI